MSILKYFLLYAVNHKAIVHQLYFIVAFLQEKVVNTIFGHLEIIYADYFP